MNSATTTLRRTLLDPGIRSFRNYLQSELGVLRQSPVLVIHSVAGESSTALSSKPVADSCQWVKFTLGQQFGLRTVPATISSAVPTRESLDETLELMQRTGASSVVSVGSGSAMDLAKAVVASATSTSTQDSNSNNHSTKAVPLILVPATYSALVAAGASHSLVLDADEETLVPFPHRHQSLSAGAEGDGNAAATACAPSVVATLDHRKYLHGLDTETDLAVLLYAVSAILLDAVCRSSTHPSLPILLSETTDLLSLVSLRKNNDNNNDDDNEEVLARSLTSLLYRSGGLLSYGLDGDNFDDEANRSIPLALGSSLIPTLFPETHPVSFFAGLVPGLSTLCASKTETAAAAAAVTGPLAVRLLEELQTIQTTLGPPPPLVTRDESLEGFSVPDMAVSHLRSNQTAWNALDAPDNVLVRVLQDSLDR
eukprot:jgi/Psemu1/294597/fgenesh1_pm.23_\